MNFKKWVKSIQTAGYNGARTVYEAKALFKSSIKQLSSKDAMTLKKYKKGF